MKERLNCKKHKIIYLVFLFIIWTIIVSAMRWVEYIYLVNADIDSWIKYEYSNPIKPEFKSGEDIVMVSKEELYHEADITFIDELYCPDYYSQVIVNQYMEEFKLTEKKWRYAWEKPALSKECHIKSTIVINLKYWLKKYKKIESWEFSIIP